MLIYIHNGIAWETVIAKKVIIASLRFTKLPCL